MKEEIRRVTVKIRANKRKYREKIIRGDMSEAAEEDDECKQ